MLHREKWRTVSKAFAGAAITGHFTNVRRPLLTDAATPLIGRDDALRALDAQLGVTTRLLTLHGPTGVGKSRLARAVVARSVGRFPGGSFWCDLQGATTSRHIVEAVARALGTEPKAADDHAVVRAPTGSEEAFLLVLDNGEAALPHLGTLVRSWLEADIHLHILLTSRERLGIAFESVRSVAPLPTPAAVHLLQLHLEAAGGGGQGDEAVLQAIVERVDGLPLAIELLARHALAFAPHELLERLEPALPVLAASEFAGTGRARSFRLALDDSWHRLSEMERTLAASCALFCNPFTHHDADAVGGVPSTAIALLLTQLVEKSLLSVVRLPPGEPTMFRMLGLTREYVLERSQSDTPCIFTRHLHAASSVAAQESSARSFTLDDSPAVFLAWLRRHAPTLLWLAARALQEKQIHSALQVLLPVCRLALLQGPVRPCLDLLENLTATDVSEPELGCETLLVRGRLRIRDGQLSHAYSDLKFALQLAADGSELETSVLIALAECQRRLGELAHAQSNYRAALVRYTERADVRGRVRVASALAGLAFEAGALDEARAHSDAALTMLKSTNMPLTEGVVLQNLGVMLQELGELDRAAHCYREALSSHQLWGHRRFEGIGEFDLGALALEIDALVEAKVRLSRALELAVEVGERRERGLCEALLGVCSAKVGQLERAEKHFQAARAALFVASEPALLEVVEVHAGHLDLARALAALLNGDEAHQRYHSMTARERLVAPGRQTCDELRFARRVLRAAWERYAGLGSELLVTRDGSWFRTPEGVRVELSHRPPLQRLLRELVRHLDVAPGTVVGAEELARAAWPEQRTFSSATKNRLNVALTTLRKGGLGPRLLRRGDGYVLERAMLLGPQS